MPGDAVGGVVAEPAVALVGRLAGHSQHRGDLRPTRAPVQGAGDEPLEVGLRGAHGGELFRGQGQGVGLAAFVPIHSCQDTLTGGVLSGVPDSERWERSAPRHDQTGVAAGLG